MQRYDIAIIGTGPAGLEAAITAKVRGKSILLLGSAALSAKVAKAHTIQNYLGLPGISGAELQHAFQAHLEQMDIAITPERINAVYAMGDYFALQGQQAMYEADAVILACGTAAAKPLPGEVEHLGQGVSYCATCDAALYRGKTALVIGYSQAEEAEAAFLAETAAAVTYLPMYPAVGHLGRGVRALPGTVPRAIKQSGARMVLETQNEPLEADGIFILRESVAPAQLVPGLELNNGHVVVDRGLHTNLPGLFACGDITGTPYQYSKAAGEGNVAALSAVSYLAANQPKQTNS